MNALIGIGAWTGVMGIGLGVASKKVLPAYIPLLVLLPSMGASIGMLSYIFGKAMISYHVTVLRAMIQPDALMASILLCLPVFAFVLRKYLEALHFYQFIAILNAPVFNRGTMDETVVVESEGEEDEEDGEEDGEEGEDGEDGEEGEEEDGEEEEGEEGEEGGEEGEEGEKEGEEAPVASPPEAAKADTVPVTLEELAAAFAAAESSAVEAATDADAAAGAAEEALIRSVQVLG